MSKKNTYKTGTKAANKFLSLQAYYKWVAAGRPGGDGKEFWLEAEREFTRSVVQLEEVIELEIE